MCLLLRKNCIRPKKHTNICILSLKYCILPQFYILTKNCIPPRKSHKTIAYPQSLHLLSKHLHSLANHVLLQNYCILLRNVAITKYLHSPTKALRCPERHHNLRFINKVFRSSEKLCVFLLNSCIFHETFAFSR